jgi:hypothetical protein
MTELQLACKKLDIIIKSGIDLDRQKSIDQAWNTMSKSSYNKRIKRQKIANICKKSLDK